MPSLMMAAQGANAAGTGLQVIGGIQSMNTADAVAKYNAEALDRQAAAARIAASYDASRLGRRAEAAQGTQEAIQAASGVDPGSGTPVDVRAATGEEYLQDELTRIMQGRQQSDAATQQAKVIRAMRPVNKMASLLGIGSTLLQGGTNAALMSRPAFWGGTDTSPSGGTK